MICRFLQGIQRKTKGKQRKHGFAKRTSSSLEIKAVKDCFSKISARKRRKTQGKAKKSPDSRKITKKYPVFQRKSAKLWRFSNEFAHIFRNLSINPLKRAKTRPNKRKPIEVLRSFSETLRKFKETPRKIGEISKNCLTTLQKSRKLTRKP